MRSKTSDQYERFIECFNWKVVVFIIRRFCLFCSPHSNDKAIRTGWDEYLRTLIASAAAAPQEVTCESPCSCSSAHGKGRWSVKNDPETPPTDTSTIQAVTPSDIFSWAGPDVYLTQQSERTGLEQKCSQ